MKIYDTLTQEVKEFVELENRKVKMYVCGPTVYDFPHLGHARCYITWDMVYRYLRFKGYAVTYARNVTDVDDKIIKKAKENNKTPKEIAEIYYHEFNEAMKALNILPPTVEPKATECIQDMLDVIQMLVEKGCAYEVDGDVYFRVSSYKKYGKLGKQNLEDLKSGARVEADGRKEDPLDFALWKSVKNSEEISWSSPWGQGRPGWHTECAAMIRRYLGDSIDIHAGGQDLTFPHHENEKAQAECSFSTDFVKYWMHNGFVIINKEKMSKSLGNFVTINDVLKHYDANTIRFFILTNHYRMPVEFAEESLSSAKAGVKRLKNAVVDAKSFVTEEKLKAADGILNIIYDELAQKGKLPFHEVDKLTDLERLIPAEIMQNVIKQFIEFTSSMDDDFNTAKSLAVLFDIAGCVQKSREANKLDHTAIYLSLLLKLSSVLGFDLAKNVEVGDGLTEKLVQLLIDLRSDAKVEKNWALSDKVRDELKKLGITLKDRKEGSTSWSIDE